MYIYISCKYIGKSAFYLLFDGMRVVSNCMELLQVRLECTLLGSSGIASQFVVTSTVTVPYFLIKPKMFE